MRILPFFTMLSFIFLLGCGDNDKAGTTGEPPEAAAAPSVFAEAEAALTEGESAAGVSRLLMADFGAVSNANGTLDMVASRDFAKIARALSDKYPADTVAAMPLYRSAEVVRAMNDPKRAAEVYRMVTERYPSFSKAPEALFMLAFTYDEDLKDLDAAKATYEKFLAAHPTHSFADDTEMLLKNLGKSDEEILKALEKQN